MQPNEPALLNKNEDHIFRDLIESISHVVYLFDDEGRFTYVSPQCEEIFGVPPEAIIGKPITSVVVPAERARISIKYKEVLAGASHLSDYQVVDKDGNIHLVRSVSRSYTGKDGKKGVVGIFSEITNWRTAEEALRESEKRYHDLITSINEGVVYVSPDLTISFLNPRLAQMLGYTIEEMIGRLVTDFIHPSYIPALLAQAKRREAGFTDQYEALIKKKDGQTIVVRISASPHRDDHGKYLGSVSAITDITERKHAEERVHESENFIRQVIKGADEGIVVYDHELRFVLWNRFMEDLCGIPEKDLLGKKATDVFPYLKDLGVELSMKRALSGETVISPPHPPVHYLGKERWLKGIYTPHYDADGNIIGIIGIIQDETERRQAEQALKESEKRFKQVAENVGDWIWEVDAEGLFTYCSTAVENLIGYTPEELVGKIHYYDFSTPDCGEGLGATALATFERKEPFRNFIYSSVHKDGRTLIFETSGVPVFDNQNNFMGYRGVSSDITVRTLTEDALQRTNQKFNLLSSITRHDILNLLMALKGFVILTRTFSKNTMFQDILINEEQIIAKITREMMLTREYQEIGIHAPLWQNVERSIKMGTNNFNLTGIDLLIENLANVEIFADPLLKKVFYNLVENAIRHGGKNHKSIRFCAHEAENRLVLICEDDGAGIPHHEKEIIFAHGYGENTGLGLFLTKEILAITGMKIRETGEPGNGARFEITVPKSAWRFTSPGKTSG